MALSASVCLATEFPPLTGRVVDQANVIPAQKRGSIEDKLKGLEDKSGIQLVVTTVSSLQGNDIETFANEGQVALSGCFVPPANNKSLELFTEGGNIRIRSLRVTELKPAVPALELDD